MEKPTIPKAVVFDLGKVLVDFDYAIAARKVAARSTKSLASLVSFISTTSPLLLQYETGLVTREQFFQEIRGATGFQGDIAEFAEYFGDVFSEITPMVALQSELHSRSMPIYAFSNINDIAVEHVKSFPFFKNFDGCIYSYEVRAMKPDARIYEAMEKLCGRRGAEIVYVDDRIENIEAGTARGWQSFLHTTPEKTRATFEKLGLVDIGAARQIIFRTMSTV